MDKGKVDRHTIGLLESTINLGSLIFLETKEQVFKDSLSFLVELAATHTFTCSDFFTPILKVIKAKFSPLTKES